MGVRPKKLWNWATLLVGSKRMLDCREFTLGSKSKVWENEVALMMWHHFSTPFCCSQFKKILHPVWAPQTSRSGPNLESKRRVYIWGVLHVSWTPSFWDMNTMICGVIQLITNKQNQTSLHLNGVWSSVNPRTITMEAQAQNRPDYIFNFLF
jgi:hypothetical protein